MLVPRCFTWVMILLIERMKLTRQRRVFASLPKASEAISRGFQEKLPNSVSLTCAVLTTINPVIQFAQLTNTSNAGASLRGK